MTAADASAAADLVARAMDPNEGAYAAETFKFHFACADKAIDDGRHLFVLEEHGRVLGIVGLHFYVWGPPQNVWLSWFAVDPDNQGSGLGGRLLAASMDEARKLGYEKVFIETYANDTFTKATRFYIAQGFHVAGTIANYLPDGSSMVVLSRSLAG